MNRRVGVWAAITLSDLVALFLLMGPLLGSRWWEGYRGFFPRDQLSYAAIATNVANGTWGYVEPFTLTGSSFYPSLWYQVLGAVSGVTHVPVQVTWTVLGMLVVLAAVTVASWTAYAVSGRVWAPALTGVLLLTGTLSIQQTGNWYTNTAAHATLWTPAGTLYPLNAEAVGMSLVAASVSALVIAMSIPMSRRRMHALVIAAVAVIGLLANIHTYSFFTAVLLVTLLVAIRSLLLARSRALLITTVVTVLIALVLGPVVASAVTPLAAFVLLLLGLAPALIPVVRAQAGFVAVLVVIGGVLASPQVLRTLVGLAQGDPFLTYREASSAAQPLSVSWWQMASSGAVFLLLLLACVVLLARSGKPTMMALTLALLAGWILLAGNDRWGFQQEPYRFWLEFVVLMALLLGPALAVGLPRLGELHMPLRVLAAALVAGAVVVWLFALADVRGFWTYARDAGVISVSDARSDALRDLVSTNPGLLVPGHCDNPYVVKLITEGPVATYNAGLAWPADEPSIRIFADPDRDAGQDPQALVAAGVRYVLTDSACPTEWIFPADQRVIAVDRATYEGADGPAELALWQVQR